MAYDWRPTATRTATTLPAVVAAPPVAGASGELGVAALVDEFIADAEAGRALNRSGRRYRPSALRDLSGILRHHVVRDLGDLRVRDVRRRHVQALVDRLAGEGLSTSRIRSVVSATRALFGYAIDRDYLEHSPADGLAIPRDDAGYDESWSWTEEPRAVREPARPVEEVDDREPIALLPERIISLVLRAVVVVFVLIALISIAGSA